MTIIWLTASGLAETIWPQLIIWVLMTTKLRFFYHFQQENIPYFLFLYVLGNVNGGSIDSHTTDKRRGMAWSRTWTLWSHNLVTTLIVMIFFLKFPLFWWTLLYLFLFKWQRVAISLFEKTNKQTKNSCLRNPIKGKANRNGKERKTIVN